MKKTFLLYCCIITGFFAEAQQYYNDIWLTRQAAAKHQLYRIQQVKRIDFKSFDAQNQPIAGFISNQRFSPDFKKLQGLTQTAVSGTSLTESEYNDKDQLIRSQDSSDGVRTVVSYTYNAAGLPQRIHRISTSPGNFSLEEVHTWEYDANGKPSRMLKVKNGRDSSFYEFVLDEKGMPAEEKGVNRGRPLPTVFYYYDEAGNLTDIVRYNRAAKRLLPDYVFEYDEKNRLGSMLVVPEEGSDYQKWYYSYDEDGLKILDACYSKTKVLIARVEYEYSYY